nr:MAG TPA: hypothetical protein [Caudoviricetes sp.]
MWHFRQVSQLGGGFGSDGSAEALKSLKTVAPYII